MEQGNENQKAKSCQCDFEKSLSLFKQELSQVDWAALILLCCIGEKDLCMLTNTSTSSTLLSSLEIPIRTQLNIRIVILFIFSSSFSRKVFNSYRDECLKNLQEDAF